MGVRVILRDVHLGGGGGGDPDLDCRFLLIGCVGGRGGARARTLSAWRPGLPAMFGWETGPHG